MGSGAISYSEIANKVEQMHNRAPGSVTVGVRLPGDVVDALDVLAAENDTNKSYILRLALINFLREMAHDTTGKTTG